MEGEAICDGAEMMRLCFRAVWRSAECLKIARRGCGGAAVAGCRMAVDIKQSPGEAGAELGLQERSDVRNKSKVLFCYQSKCRARREQLVDVSLGE